MSAPLNSATLPQIQAELLGRAYARGLAQVDRAKAALEALRAKQGSRVAEVRGKAMAECGDLRAPLEGLPAIGGELAYWQWVRRAYPEASLPYIDLLIRILEVAERARKECAS